MVPKPEIGGFLSTPAFILLTPLTSQLPGLERLIAQKPKTIG